MARDRNLHTVITANAQQMLAETKRVQQQLQSLQSAASGMRTAFAAVVGGANPIDILTGGLQNALGMIPYIGPGLQVATIGVRALREELESTGKEILDMAKDAKKAGADFEGFAGLKRAGADSEAMVAGLGHLRRSLEEAASGNAELKKTFEGLGLDPIKELAKKTDVAFLDLADAYKDGTNAGHRNADMAKILGKNYRELIPVLTKSRAELERIKESGLKSGIIPSKDIVESLREAEIAGKMFEEENTHGMARLSALWSHEKTAAFLVLSSLANKKSVFENMHMLDEKKERHELDAMNNDTVNQLAAMAARREIQQRQEDEDNLHWFQREQIQEKGQEKLRQSAMTAGEKYADTIEDLDIKIKTVLARPMKPGQELTDLIKLKDKAKEQIVSSVPGAMGEMDAFALRLAKLDDLLKHNALDADQYARAIEEIGKGVADVNSSSVTIPETILQGSKRAFDVEYRAQNQDDRTIQQKMLAGIEALKERQAKATKDGAERLQVLKGLARGIGVAP